MTLDGQIALVTGASRGIGAGIAKALGQAGATVIGTATSEQGANQITESFSIENIKGMGTMLDVNDLDQIEQMFKKINEIYGTISILVNNAGVTRDTLLMRMSEEDWDTVLNTNLKSVFRLSQAVLRPMMKLRQGRIITISSVVGHMGNAGQANYAAAKAGIAGFTKSLAREVGSRGITVNAIAPGFIDTDMTRALTDSQRESLVQHVPMGRFGQVDDIAAAVVFLAGSSAGYITGETIHVNGGMYMA